MKYILIQEKVMEKSEILKHYENEFLSSPVNISDEDLEVLIKSECQCDYCSVHITDMYDFPEIFDNEVMCEECYKEHNMSICPTCEDYYDTKDGDSGFILVTKELSKDQKIPMGIYKVLKRPFFYGNILSGFESFFNNSLQLVANINIDEYESATTTNYKDGDITSDFICPECVAKYTTFKDYLLKEGKPCILIQNKGFENGLIKEYTPEQLKKVRQLIIHQRINSRGLIQKSQIKQ